MQDKLDGKINYIHLKISRVNKPDRDLRFRFLC